MWQLTLLFFLALASASAAPPPDCSSERDGQYEDEDNCAGFYRCQDGELSREDCPWGLFFNAGVNSGRCGNFGWVKGCIVADNFCKKKPSKNWTRLKLVLALYSVHVAIAMRRWIVDICSKLVPKMLVLLYELSICSYCLPDTSLCDWALAVGCELSTSEIESLRLPQTIDVFYTSDDFPSYNYGSENTLNAAYVRKQILKVGREMYVRYRGFYFIAQFRSKKLSMRNFAQKPLAELFCFRESYFWVKF